jgi:hypothetical protein
VPDSHATPRRSKTRFDSWRGHLFDAGARRHGGCLQSSLKWVRLPPASFECNYKQGLTSLGQRRAAHSINGWCRVFRTWNLAKAMLNPPPRLAQWVEHQTVIWLSRVRLPYRPAGRKPANAKSVRASPRVADRSFGQSRVVASLWRDGSAAATRTDAKQCVDTAFAHAASDDHGRALSRCERCSRRRVRRNGRMTLRS